MPTSSLVIHSESLSTHWPKLYIIEPGQDPSGNECALVRQLPVEDCCLRSAASFLYLTRASTSSAYLWHGCSSKPFFRRFAHDVVSELVRSPSSHFKLAKDSVDVVEITEGNEPKDFFNGTTFFCNFCKIKIILLDIEIIVLLLES